jgi:hypothetical protein
MWRKSLPLGEQDAGLWMLTPNVKSPWPRFRFNMGRKGLK